MAHEQGQDKTIIAGRLDELFDKVQPEGRRFRLREVVDGVNERAGQTLLSIQYLSQLRNGLRKNPSPEVLRAIAQWFGVPPAYFFDDELAARTDEELRFLKLMQDARVRKIAFRSQGMSPQSLEFLAEMVEKLRKADGVPETEPAADITWNDPG